MHYKVEIETRPVHCTCCWQPLPHMFRGESVSGPVWAKGWNGSGATSEAAFADVQGTINRQYPQHSFDFVHTPA